jgi:TRAP-type C4-dicarboxylate transport system permease small subunit
MEVFYKMLPDNGRRFLGLIIYLLMGVVIFVILIHGIFLVEHATGQRSPATGISMSWIYACLPVGSVLMAIHLFTLFFKDALGRSEASRDGDVKGSG